ncbi:Rdx family-domain-containing protein [Durotheca rogersii]|uniref:Rdx family-domain-containing protein n=1 Tax=Durotheca rogersii TaxID=419775 RepID=UPI0022201EDF|nr:Rdx family-domain-containing protein [Durotheca rogersii]KAI5868006.1 Rdx family-domain-containing protein [Durotheca rogersii]
MAETSLPSSISALAPRPLPLPRITIRFCTQCKWMLRAAYFAQELLSTFSTSLGEVALQPATGGIFVVEIYYTPFPAATASRSLEAPSNNIDDGGRDGAPIQIQHRVLWDRKLDGGFPETKELKRRVRDTIDPGRDLGHVDRHSGTAPSSTGKTATTTATATTVANQPGTLIGAGAAVGGAATSSVSGGRASEASIGLNTHPGGQIGGTETETETGQTNHTSRGDCEDCK